MTENKMKEIILEEVKFNFNQAIYYARKYFSVPKGDENEEIYHLLSREYQEKCLEANNIYRKLFGSTEISNETLIHKFVYCEELENE